jgi:hypothetical protein
MTGPRRGAQRGPGLELLAEALSGRDWAIIGTLHRVRLATGLQLERLHFNDLAARSRSVKRWQVLKRLADARVLMPLDRRIGTARRGSAKLRYALDSMGERLIRLWANRESPETPMRRPRVPGDRFIAHTLAITELYVALVEEARSGRFILETFQAEAAAYWPNGLGGQLKPDAFIKLSRDGVTDYWWYEADLATESLPTIRTKLLVYFDFAIRGQLGPDGVMPRVLIGVPTAKRRAAVQIVTDALPKPADAIFVVVGMSEVAHVMADEILKQ